MSTIDGRGLTVGGIGGIMEREFPSQDLGIDGVMKRTEHTMKAYIISMLNDHDSTVATRKLLRSIEITNSNVDAMSFNAVTPETMDANINRLFGSQMPYAKIQYTYPKTAAENRLDILSGLNLFFVRTFDFESISARVTGNILGLNDPSGATRKPWVYNSNCIERHNTFDHQWFERNKGKARSQKPEYTVFTAPNVDNDNKIPQGLAGNSAYIIRPEGAANLMGLVAEHGFWPNDAIMCKQLLPRQLMQIYPYVTKVQGTTSTTST